MTIHHTQRLLPLVLAAATLATCLLTASASAAPRDSEKRIRAALDKKVALDFEDTPLVEAVAFIKDLASVEVQLDLKAIDEAGLASDTPITFDVKDISLKSALNLMLRPLDLTYVYKDEVLLITTPEQVEKFLKVKVYDVRDLLP